MQQGAGVANGGGIGGAAAAAAGWLGGMLRPSQPAGAPVACTLPLDVLASLGGAAQVERSCDPWLCKHLVSTLEPVKRKSGYITCKRLVLTLEACKVMKIRFQSLACQIQLVPLQPERRLRPLEAFLAQRRPRVTPSEAPGSRVVRGCTS